MKKIESFPHLIGSILNELEMASQIRIDCQAAEEYNGPDAVAPIRVVAVNGMDTPWRYQRHIKHLKAGVLGQFREVIPHIDPAGLDTFIDLALRRVRRITRSVMVTEFGMHEQGIGQDVCWSFGQLQCFLGEVESDDPLVYMEAMIQTRRWAWIYYLELKRLEERINCFSGATISLSVMDQAEHTCKPVQKVLLNCTVPFLGAMMRVAYDRNLIECPNIAELCRMISQNFCTTRQEKLSPHSIRNHFDNPLPEALEKVMNESLTWHKYLPALIERQKR